MRGNRISSTLLPPVAAADVPPGENACRSYEPVCTVPERVDLDMLYGRKVCKLAVSCVVVAVGMLQDLGTARAANPDYQTFFFQACTAPEGNLAQRCAETPDGLGDLSGDSESSLNPSQSLNAGSASRSAAQARSEALRERLASDRDDAESSGAPIGPLSVLVNGRWVGESQDRGIDAAERDYSMDTVGLQFGFDRRFGDNWTLGALLTWETSDLDFGKENDGVNFAPIGRAGNVSQDGLGATLFATARLHDRLFLDFGAGFVAGDYMIERNAIFQESGRSVPQTHVITDGSTDGRELWATAVLTASANLSVWNVSGHAGLTWSDTEIDGFTERDRSASGLAMRFDDQSTETRLGQLGARASRAISGSGFVLVPQVSFEYVHDFIDDPAEARSVFLLDSAGNVLTLRGERRQTDYLELALGVVMLLPNGWIPFLEYQTTLWHGDLDRDRVALGLRVEL